MKTIQQYTDSNFQFSGISTDRLGASEYTVVTIAIDMSSSVRRFEKELKESIKSIVASCKKSPRSENLLIRLVSFNNNVYEEHGFTMVSDIDINSYDSVSSPSGMTALYDASVSAIEATEQYSRNLTEQDFDVNGIVFIVTDGADNRSQNTANDVSEALKKAVQSESMESIRSVLIGVNTADSSIKSYLNDFMTESNIDQYVDIQNATPDSLAKLADFVSKSISIQSVSLGTGGPSQAIAF